MTTKDLLQIYLQSKTGLVQPIEVFEHRTIITNGNITVSYNWYLDDDYDKEYKKVQDAEVNILDYMTWLYNHLSDKQRSLMVTINNQLNMKVSKAPGR